MDCAIHTISPPQKPIEVIPKGSVVIFGLSLCVRHAGEVVDALIEGASVREILQEAREGEWL